MYPQGNHFYLRFRYFLEPVFAFFLFILLLPVLAVLAIIGFGVHFENPFFIQTRIGLNEKTFQIYKLKTFFKTPSSITLKVSQWGKFLRKYGLDEIPQLINIFKGEMSFIGPRPLLPEYIPYYNASQRKRHSLKPGLMGWAQLHSHLAQNWERKFELDCQYVESKNIFEKDIYIVWQTFKMVFIKKSKKDEALILPFDMYMESKKK